MPKVSFLVLPLMLLACGGASAGAQTLSTATAAALTDMASRAGVIFTGRVVSVTPAQGFVDIKFAVETAIKGCSQTHPYVLREWAGLWSAPTPRYLPGERLLMLLTARSPAGLSAPVDGPAGIIPLLPTATQPLANRYGAAPADPGLAPAALAPDLRWVDASLPRTNPANATSMASRAAAPVAIDGGWSGPAAALPTASQPTLAAVITLLRAANVNAGTSQ